MEARQFLVNIHFERKTPDDYLKAAFRKVCKIHSELPQGGILVFLSSQREVEQLIKWLIMRYPSKIESNKKINLSQKVFFQILVKIKKKI